MKHIVAICLFIAAAMLAPTAVPAQLPEPTRSVTLYSSEAGELLRGPSLVSFLRNETRGMWESGPGSMDVCYGNLRVGSDWNWFFIGTKAQEDRSVIRDLGWGHWRTLEAVPPLCPRPVLEAGQTRRVTVDASGDSKALSPEGYIVKAVEGHMYVMRLKDETTDQYVVFRVERLGADETCVLTWQLVPHPKTGPDCETRIK